MKMSYWRMRKAVWTIAVTTDDAVLEYHLERCQAAGMMAPTLAAVIVSALAEAAAVLPDLPGDPHFRGMVRRRWAFQDEAPARSRRMKRAWPADAVARTETVLGWFSRLRTGERRSRGLSDGERRRRTADALWALAEGRSAASVARRWSLHRGTVCRLQAAGIEAVADPMRTDWERLVGQGEGAIQHG
ncbi:MAG: hypothetical protein VYB54_15710 [Pseudomonadota bacterium]|nr:hypothetical protein [Pseudomonadota bacterium]